MFPHNLKDIDLNDLGGENPAPNVAKVSSKNDVSIINDMGEFKCSLLNNENSENEKRTHKIICSIIALSQSSSP